MTVIGLHVQVWNAVLERYWCSANGTIPYCGMTPPQRQCSKGGYVLLVVPCNIEDILSPLWSKNHTLLGAEWKTTLVAIAN